MTETIDIDEQRKGRDLVDLLNDDEIGCSHECLCAQAAAEIHMLRAQIEGASSIIRDTFPAHRIIVSGNVGQPDEKETTWKIDLGLVRRAHEFLCALPTGQRKGD